MPVSKVVEITNQVALPLISKQQDDLRRVSQSFSKSLRLALTAGFPVMWGMAVVAQDLTILLLGPKWQSAVLVIQLIAVAMPLKLAGSLCGVALLAVGRADLSFRTILKSLVLAIILLHIGTRWGLPGAAFAVSAATILGTFIALGAVSACIPIERKVLLAELLRAAAPALVMVACVGALQYFTMQMQTLPRCVISVLCGAAVWVATIRTMAFALWEELVDNLGRFSGLR
jgi:O-antigen/teichoic acid export membrane protein